MDFQPTVLAYHFAYLGLVQVVRAAVFTDSKILSDIYKVPPPSTV